MSDEYVEELGSILKLAECDIPTPVLQLEELTNASTFHKHSGSDFVELLRCPCSLLISHMHATFWSLNLCFSSL